MKIDVLIYFCFCLTCNARHNGGRTMLTHYPIKFKDHHQILRSQPHDTILDWKLKEATLVRQLEKGKLKVALNGDEGLLYVTLVSNKTGEERRGTVCDDEFNMHAARLFCESMVPLAKERQAWNLLLDKPQ